MKVKMLVNWDDRHIGTEKEVQNFLEESFEEDIWKFHDEIEDIFDNYTIEEIFNMLSKENKSKITTQAISEKIHYYYEEIEVEI